MAGLHFMKDDDGRPQVPFHTVYIHALVRDEHGAKMSKSKGNSIDPLELVDEFGADALRFTLAAMAAQGRDVRLSKSRVEGYRNFTTKLWNAARFAQMNKCAVPAEFDPQTVKGTANRWIIGELAKTIGAVTTGIETYRFNEAASALYRFVWNVYCDWYLEIVKPEFSDQTSQTAAETRATTAWVLDQILKLLHPFTPFITEVLWAEMAVRERQTALITAPWPPQTPGDTQAGEEMDWVIGLITEVRSTRAELNVPPGARLPLVVVGAIDARLTEQIKTHTTTLLRLARLERIEFADQPPENSVQIVHQAKIFGLPLAGAIDMRAEADRLAREIDKSNKEIADIDKKLANENFTSRAPAHVVETQRQRRDDAHVQTQRLESAHARLASAL
ncbi:MAG: class I tRNA ligase family protein, partial [Alphaproteobacteria bacterium]